MWSHIWCIIPRPLAGFLRSGWGGWWDSVDTFCGVPSHYVGWAWYPLPGLPGHKVGDLSGWVFPSALAESASHLSVVMEVTSLPICRPEKCAATKSHFRLRQLCICQLLWWMRSADWLFFPLFWGVYQCMALNVLYFIHSTKGGLVVEITQRSCCPFLAPT